MPLYILTETAAGYALLKAKDKKILDNNDLAKDTDTAEKICAQLKLKSFQKFTSAATALEEVSALVEGKVSSRLSDLLNQLKDEKKAALAVADPKLANAIRKLPNLSITPISDASTAELYRSIRAHLSSLIPGLLPDDVATMSLGLSHSLSRHKLRFSPDKVDTMIVQAIALLDDLDKELNTYAMRAKEWYGWHFPEMGKIVNDNLAYSRIILKMGLRTNAATSDLADILPEEIETAVKAAAEVSMGTEISTEDLDNIQALAEQVVNFTEYRQQLSSYLSSRMVAIAPNLTALVGDLVGARLIAHAGSLMSLAKSPASTIQILGAEKALFRALKTKHDTPKYGLIYHASLVGQATGKNKGKIARVLAAKAAIGIRVDALADWGIDSAEENLVTDEERASLGIESRLRIERKLAALEGRALRPKGVSIAPNAAPSSTAQKWVIKEAQKYNQDADGVAIDAPPAKVDKVATNGTTNGELQLLSTILAGNQSVSDEETSSSEDDENDESEQTPATIEAVANNTVKPPRQKGPTPKEAQKIAKRLRREKRLAARAERKAEKAVKRAKREQFKKHRVENMISSALNGNKEPSVIAMALGMSTKKYLRKVEKGSIKFNENGIPLKLFEVAKTIPSQKDAGSGKRKSEAQTDSSEPPGKKRKESASE